jgi:hypothetical protein
MIDLLIIGGFTAAWLLALVVLPMFFEPRPKVWVTVATVGAQDHYGPWLEIRRDSDGSLVERVPVNMGAGDFTNVRCPKGCSPRVVCSIGPETVTLTSGRA